MSSPLVSISMISKIDSEQSLIQTRDAISSILNQTYTNIELIIVDGSDNHYFNALKHFYLYGVNDSRVFLHKEIPLKNSTRAANLANAQNQSCKLANGKYIAIMDSDDISLPTRIQKEVEFLESHPNIGIVGSWLQEIPSNKIVSYPTEPSLVKWAFIFGNCLGHPSVMARREILASLGYYRPYFFVDYDLWARANNITAIANIPEPLVMYRTSDRTLKPSHRFIFWTLVMMSRVFRNVIKQNGLNFNLLIKAFHSRIEQGFP